MIKIQNEANNKIAETLKKLRESKGVSVSEVAIRCNVSPKAINQYETGERIPRDEVKIRFADYYNKSVSAIFNV